MCFIDLVSCEKRQSGAQKCQWSFIGKFVIASEITLCRTHLWSSLISIICILVWKMAIAIADRGHRPVVDHTLKPFKAHYVSLNLLTILVNKEQRTNPTPTGNRKEQRSTWPVVFSELSWEIFHIVSWVSVTSQLNKTCSVFGVSMFMCHLALHFDYIYEGMRTGRNKSQKS